MLIKHRATLSALLKRVRAGGCEPLVETFVDAMTTNETRWFRDRTPFDLFREELLPGLAAARPDGAVKVWCAAASTGQEPWSLAMIAQAAPRARADILGTDISERCLIKARAGIYSAFEVQRGLPVQLMLRWFDKIDGVWRIKAQLRRAVRWDRVNLVEDFSRLGRFDVVFRRNVLIYFDEATRAVSETFLASFKSVLLRMALMRSTCSCTYGSMPRAAANARPRRPWEKHCRPGWRCL